MEKPNVKRNWKDRWSSLLVKDGVTPVSSFFLEYYHKLIPEITHGEAMFIIQLMSFKWGNDMPFPAFKTLATRMSIKVAQARNLGRGLERKGYLRRHKQIGQTNKFDLKPLFEKLESLYDSVKTKSDKPA